MRIVGWTAAIVATQLGLIAPISSQETDTRTIQGIVRDSTNGETLPFATVTIPGTPFLTISNDLKQPRHELLRLPAIVQSIQRFHKRVLTNILGVHPIAENCQGNGIGSPVVPPHQGLERDRLAAESLRHKRGVCYSDGFLCHLTLPVWIRTAVADIKDN